MRPFRPHAALLAALLLHLAACHRESATVRTEQKAPAPAPAAAVAPAEAPAPVRRDWHRLTKPTSRRAPLIRYQAVQRPASLPAPVLTAEAQLLDLTLKPSEFFRIDPTQPTEVRGREGTVLRLPAQALVNAQGQPVTEPVWVELKECLTLAELLLSDCVSRNAAGTPMQTGGMLLVRASTRAGQRLQLAPGHALELELPQALAAAGRQLYHSPDRHRWAALPAETVDFGSTAYATLPADLAAELAADSSPTAEPAPRAIETTPLTTTLRCAALGWLTCLRSWPGAGATSLLVPADVDAYTTVRLVFPDAGVILAGTPQAGGYAFAGLPERQRAVLVGLRYEGGNAFLAVQPLRPGQPADTLRFRAAELGDIEQRLADLR